jgi:hypothetical protein
VWSCSVDATASWCVLLQAGRQHWRHSSCSNSQAQDGMRGRAAADDRAAAAAAVNAAAGGNVVAQLRLASGNVCVKSELVPQQQQQQQHARVCVQLCASMCVG